MCATFHTVWHSADGAGDAEESNLPLPGSLSATPGGYGSGEAYDRYMGRWSSLLARQFLRFAGISTARCVLDVGSGTGSLTKVIANAVPVRRIVGIDPVQQFVHSARRNIRDPRVVFNRGQVERLPFTDNSFDAGLAQLCVHHFPDGRRAIREIMRVTRSGGVVAACEWDAGPGMEMFQVLHDAIASVLRQDGRPRPARRYSARGELVDLWQACGMTDVEGGALSVQRRFTGFEDFWVPFTEGPSVVCERYCKLSPLMQEDFRRRLKQRLLKGNQDGPFTLHALAWAVKGRVPQD